MRHTKILATIGPASFSEKVLTELISTGISGCRINFSHTSFEKAEELIWKIRKVSEKLAKPICIRQDLQGPKIRIGELAQEEVVLRRGQAFKLALGNIIGDQECAGVAQKEFMEALQPGATVVIGDNELKLEVIHKERESVDCKVIIGGALKPQKGVSAPGTFIDFKGLTKKDLSDLDFGIRQKVDCVSMSFVQSADDIYRLKEIIREQSSQVPVIAKIEQYNSLKNLDEIIKASDGISIARGDLAVERPLEELGLIQKEIIRRCNIAGKFVMAGSGILQNLRKNLWPTRAEVNDVTALIFEGIDAISFSDETAIGDYPVESVRTLATIIESVEKVILTHHTASDSFYRNIDANFTYVQGKESLVLCTDTLEPVVKLAKMHYTAPLLVGTKSSNEANYLSNYWGVYPIYCPPELMGQEMFDYVVNKAIALGIIDNKNPIINLNNYWG
ncbi:pyruvate kinase [Candidatus Formimonas warabiya]|uniref:Pyruvate kinase n=1 Tax=Formimonas warabiya TaxID=1761012 RepID=A0A3G1KMZ4_FORW1|nr:pyruvate kinase [Candidatus Formimonas warabiya]ATW23475.1 pyruvate kinase [Candidatus Formimonas warabiya]